MKQFFLMAILAVMVFSCQTEDDGPSIDAQDVSIDEEQLLNSVEETSRAPRVLTESLQGSYTIKEYYTKAIFYPEGTTLAFWAPNAWKKADDSSYLIDDVGNNNFIIMNPDNGLDFHTAEFEGDNVLISEPLCGERFSVFNSCKRGVKAYTIDYRGKKVGYLYTIIDGKIYFVSRETNNFPGEFSMARLATYRSPGLIPALFEFDKQ